MAYDAFRCWLPDRRSHVASWQARLAPSRSPLVLLLVFALLGCHLQAAEDSSSAISFNQQIRPILSDRCFSCHGPDIESRKADLRLDIPDGDEGALAWAIEPGSAEESEVWRRISSEDEDEIMPPPNSHKPSLTKAEQQLIRDWIEAGANYETFWAFTPPAAAALGNVNNDKSTTNPIDQFVATKLGSKGLQPATEADPRTLIRRVTLGLTGLPPTLEETTQFVSDWENHPHDQVWETLVDRLIASEAFGEHLARYWLDLVRFADTNGMHKDFYRNHVAYRDWVIRSFNENLGYDDFLKYQLAGDLYPEPTTDQLIASGFNRLHLIIDRGTALPEESFYKNVLDRVASVGTTFMGLTVQCAQCHDHKYDPITQKDFYSLYAFFNNIDAAPETVRSPAKGLQAPFISLATPEQQKKLQEYTQRINELDKKIAKAKAEQGDAKEETSKVKELTSQQNQTKKSREQLEQSIPGAMVMRERKEPRPTYLLVRGEYDAPGEQVQRGTPGFLPPMQTQGEIATRMDLANWFVDPNHPLTARVAVNRYWQQFFGVGLVKTSEDFGGQGEVPSHPALLDYLAVSFVQSGWDTKALIKEIVMSKTYRQSSVAAPDIFKADPENRLLARGSRYRMDAEMIRDQILATSGLLSPEMYGPSVKPPQPAGLWKTVSMTGEVFSPDKGDAIYRRSLYTFWKRAMPPPQMTILNAPNRDYCVARRERTNTPSQALLLLNEPEYLKAACKLAKDTIEQSPDTKSRVDHLWQTITLREPDEIENKAIESLVADLMKRYGQHPELAQQLCQGTGVAGTDIDDAKRQAELATWTVVANTLYNLDITKTLD
ncbi:Planctomycete cytochrome C [Roseimaritima multifibrata]|uniref:Planctomycete cytochrome C n=1 Tax=Roseimaritima multifibrata TaxID=1930274 RepID=A0A517M9G3_9BACT|nr:DUF1553 domain-containing protein [Roseimaritima multifibrata]QDS91471.1 Planctomycete cytochrome C [Roseimaritima multifibrata]